MTVISPPSPPEWHQTIQERGSSRSVMQTRETPCGPFLVSIGSVRTRTLLDRIDAVAEGASISNWDAEGGVAVEHGTREYARMFARALAADMPKPDDVAVDKDGDISFEWNQGPRRILSISVSRDGTLNYAGLFGPNEADGTEILLSQSLPVAAALAIRRVEIGF